MIVNLYPNPHDYKSIHCTTLGSEWHSFIDLIKLGIKNRNGSSFPIVKLNKDQSVSILLDKPNVGIGVNDEIIGQEFIANQLKFYQQYLNLPLIREEELLTRTEDDITEIVEYRFNISIYHLDTILKLNNYYTAYNTEGNILRLIRSDVPLKSGSIYLFPVFPLSEEKYLARVAGCQVTEISSVQLLQFIPEKKGHPEKMHYTPAGFSEKFNLNYIELNHLLIKILEDEGIIIENSEAFYAQAMIGFSTILKPSDQGHIKITDIDVNAQDFYILHGSSGVAELENCKSLEINTLYLLQRIREMLQNKYNNDAQYDFVQNVYGLSKAQVSKNISSLSLSIEFVDELIKNEVKRIAIENTIFNRDIKIFEGNMAVFGSAMSGFENKNNQLDNMQISEQVYTVNNNAIENPDLVADIGSEDAMAVLPDNRFDVICFKLSSNDSINLQTAFETAHRVLQSDGVLIFIGSVEVNNDNNKDSTKSPTFFGKHSHSLSTDSGNRVINNNDVSFLDTTGMLTLAGFKQGKPLSNNGKPADGSIVIASKSEEPIDIEALCKKIPALQTFLENNDLGISKLNSPRLHL